MSITNHTKNIGKKLWYRTKDPRSRFHKKDQAFHMQFHRDLMHKSHSFEGISPDQKRNYYSQQKPLHSYQ